MLSQMLANGQEPISKDEIADLLKVSPELLEQFEEAYSSTSSVESDDNLFSVSAKEAAKESKRGKIESDVNVDSVVERIVDELLIKAGIINKEVEFLVPDEINSLPQDARPQLAGNLIQRDISQSSYIPILSYYKDWKETGNTQSYYRFRQGLDILDIDPITYEIIGMNKNSMGYWLSEIEKASDKTEFFKYPKTTVVKVPLTLLQLTRLDYMSHTPTTIRILNEFCMRAFNLDVNKKYFIKTGVYSSKFDFRNALVEGPQEVRELGEYLLFIHFQALQMASPLSSPTIYGVSTTNEWVVREFIDDVEDNPTIYQGMPLHTEYRFFVDLDDKEILGVSPYWREDVMKKSFSEGNQNNHKKHDYVIYKMHEEELYRRFYENIDKVTTEMEKLIKEVNLPGQWSIDVMQNGDDFYVIDLAQAAESALSDVVDPSKLKKLKEEWIPLLEEDE